MRLGQKSAVTLLVSVLFCSAVAAAETPRALAAIAEGASGLAARAFGAARVLPPAVRVGLAAAVLAAVLALVLRWRYRRASEADMQARIRPLQAAFIVECRDRPLAELAACKETFRATARASLGRRAWRHGAAFERIVARSWEEILAALSAHRADMGADGAADEDAQSDSGGAGALPAAGADESDGGEGDAAADEPMFLDAADMMPREEPSVASDQPAQIIEEHADSASAGENLPEESAAGVEMEEVSVDEFLRDDTPAEDEADAEQARMTESLGFVYLGDIVADEPPPATRAVAEVIGFGSPTLIYGLNSNFVADSFDVGHPDFSELDAVAELVPLEEGDEDDDMLASDEHEIPLVPLGAEEAMLPPTDGAAREPVAVDEGAFVSLEELGGDADGTAAVPQEEDAIAQKAGEDGTADSADAPQEAEGKAQPPESSQEEAADVPHEAEGDGGTDDIPVLEGADSRRAFSFSCFGRSNVRVTELPPADEDDAAVPSEDAIVADADGTFRIAEHLPRGGTALDAQLQALIDSVLR